MADTLGPPLNKKGYTVLLLISLALAVLLLSFRYFLPTKLIYMAGAGVIACVIGLLLFAHPKQALLIAVFYVYASLTYYFKVRVGYPLIGLVIVAVMINQLRGHKFTYPSSAFNWALGLFVVFMIQSMLFAWDFSYSFAEILRLTRSLVMLYLVVHLIRSPHDLRRYSLWILASVVVMIVMGFANLMLGIETARAGDAQGNVRFASTQGDPNQFGVIVASALPLAVFAIRHYRRWLVRILLAAAIVFMIVMIFSTLSRAVIFPVVFIVFAVLLREGRNRVGLGIAMVLVAATVLLVPASYWYRLGSLNELASSVTADWSLRLRLMAMKTAWQMFLDNPLTGIGVGNFKVRGGSDLFVRIVAHNAFLEVLVGVGLFGFIAFATMLGVVIRDFRKAIVAKWPKEYSFMPHLSFYSLTALGCVLIGEMFLSMPFHYLLWLPAAAGLAAGRCVDHYASAPENP